ncbi:hypothetical protein SAMN04487943_101605 [Gracilibacillus orientalis]|uniref:Uncharacterized protein n=1 Tax=Gracilibacillus orientalis TaxID=334253 RepID=A0A1I4HS77_9BACI|nr:hypothetical protein SAMN04487943_101605 [Gracilibacillus orientalis]
MSKLALLCSLVLSIVVSVINFINDSYIDGAVMAIVAVLVLSEFIKQYKNESE